MNELARLLHAAGDAVDAWSKQQVGSAAQLDRMEKTLADIAAEEATLVADEQAFGKALDDLAAAQGTLLAEVRAIVDPSPALTAAAAAFEGATTRVRDMVAAAAPTPPAAAPETPPAPTP